MLCFTAIPCGKQTCMYDVPLVGSDGTKATAVVACHKDTSGWNPSLSIFKQLNVEPGTAAFCHLNYTIL